MEQVMMIAGSEKAGGLLLAIIAIGWQEAGIEQKQRVRKPFFQAD
jgi:hypothetical protein